MDILEWFQFALLAGAAIVGIAVGLLHMYGWVPPRYRRMLADVQRSTADTIAASIKSEAASFSAGVPELPGKIQAALHAELELAAQSLDSGIKALPLQLSAAVAPIADGMGKAVADGFGAVLGELGGSAQGAAVQPAATQARITNSLAKQGAKKLLASLAAQVHPAAGLAVGVAQGIGVLDDDTAERIATFLLDNPELMAQVNAAGRRVAEARGIVSPEGTTGRGIVGSGVR